MLYPAIVGCGHDGMEHAIVLYSQKVINLQKENTTIVSYFRVRLKNINENLLCVEVSQLNLSGCTSTPGNLQPRYVIDAW